MTDSTENTTQQEADIKETTPQEATVEAKEPAEKMLTQTQVNDIVSKVRADAKKSVMQSITENATQTQNQVQQPPQQQNIAASSNLTEEEIQRRIQHEVERKSAVDADARTATEFVSKLEAATSKYPDFVADTEALQLGKIPMDVISVLNSVDNIDDVLHDISTRCPEKFTEIVNTARWSPALAKKALSKLSDSIKKNQTAVKDDVNPPLSQTKPSISGTDNGKLTIRDLKKQPWLQGI